MSAQSPYVVVNGIRTYYETRGEGPPAGIPVLLLHGGMGTVDDFAPLGPSLASYRCILPERRGHGRTPDAGDITYDLMAEDKIAFMEATGVEGAALVGYSDGAIVALMVAMARPHLVRRLVLMGCNYHRTGLTAAFRQEMRAHTPDSWAKASSGPVRRYRALSPDGADHYPAIFEKIRRLWLTGPTLDESDLACVIAPTLVIAADRDLIDLDHTVRLFSALPNAQLFVVPGSSHEIMRDRTRLVGSVITDFLDRS